MSITSAQGGIALAERRLATTLADCTEFRTLVGAEDAEEALARIYFTDIPRPAEGQTDYTREQLVALRPFAVIQTDLRRGYRFRNVAAYTNFVDGGELRLLIEANLDNLLVDGEEAGALLGDDAEALRRFGNVIGKILQRDADDAEEFRGVLDLAHSPDGDYLAIESGHLDGPFRSDRKEATDEGDHLFAILHFDWGTR